MKIKRYRLKENVTWDDICKLPRIQDGGEYIDATAKKMFWVELYKNIDLCVAFPENLATWDDFNFICIIDDDWGQPYTPFYNHLNNPDKKPFPCVEQVINNYHKCMSEIGIFEEKE